MLGKSVPRSLSSFFEDPMNLSIRFIFLSSFSFVYGKASWGSLNIHIRGCTSLVTKDRNGRIPGRISDLFVLALEYLAF